MSPEPLPPETKAARNERRKAFAATLNALSVAGIVAALIQPVAIGGTISLELSFAAMAIFVVFQNLLHYVFEED